MFGRSVWSGVGVAICVLLIGLLIDTASLNSSCFKEENGGVTLAGSCTTGNVTLKVPAEELNFEATYSDKKLAVAIVQLDFANCSIKGQVAVADGGSAVWIIGGVSGEFTITGAATAKKVNLESNGTDYPISCSSSVFTKTKSGSFTVPIAFTTSADLAALVFNFKNATIYTGEPENQWSVGGWRLWLVVGCCVLVVLALVVAIGGLVWKFCCNRPVEVAKPDAKNKPGDQPATNAKPQANQVPAGQQPKVEKPLANPPPNGGPKLMEEGLGKPNNPPVTPAENVEYPHEETAKSFKEETDNVVHEETAKSSKRKTPKCLEKLWNFGQATEAPVAWKWPENDFGPKDAKALKNYMKQRPNQEAQFLREFPPTTDQVVAMRTWYTDLDNELGSNIEERKHHKHANLLPPIKKVIDALN